MKAVLLAAGKGVRLNSITETLPKPMIRFQGKPILQYNIESCRESGITKIFINTHHLSNQIQDFFENGNKFGVEIVYSHEEELLGTAGALNNFKNYLSQEPFFVIYADQIIEFELKLLIEKYLKHDCLATIAFHYREDIEHCGVAEFDGDDKILRFIEKPKRGETESHWVNAGIYYLNPHIYEFIPFGNSDFGKDIFPNILADKKSLYAVYRKINFKVFDTPELYNKNILGSG